MLIIKALANKQKHLTFRKVLILFCAFCVVPVLVFAQKKDHQDQVKNNPSKYNRYFDGIGPKVFLTPPPKTEKQIITDRYILKRKEHPQVESLLLKINFDKDLKRFEIIIPVELANSLIINNEEQKLIAGIHYYKKKDNKTQLSRWQNNLAILYITLEKYEQASALLIDASENQEQFGSIEDQFAILNNFTQLELNAANIIKALSLYDKLLLRAKKSKNNNYQALSYIEIAKLQAPLGNFSEAHNLIIKKTMPLLQRSKNYSTIVKALNYLGSFKELQKQETEAKWIYLQAVDVAKNNNDEDGLAISFFNLAQIKHKAGDDALAIADYKSAKEIAVKNNMDNLLIAINDGMGDAYLKLNDFKAATLVLNEYQILKLNLLKRYL